MKKHTLYTSIFASAIILAGSLFFSACSDEEIIDSPSLVPTGEGIFFGTSIGNGSQWAPDVIGRSAKEEKQKPLVIEGEDGFSITATVEDGIKMRNNEPKTQSRGTQVTEAANVKAFDVAAYKNVNNAYEHYFTETVTDGVNPSEKRFWPSKGTVDFIATYPQGIFSSQFPTAAEYADGFSFNYTVKDNVEEQEDIMVACPKGLNNGESGEAVPLQFQHLLAAVQFKMGKMLATRVNSIKISGVMGETASFIYTEGKWSCDLTKATSNTSYSPSLSYVDQNGTTKTVDTSTLDEGADITGNDYNSMMMVIPQSVSGATVTVNYTELLVLTNGLPTTREKTITLPDHSWEAGKTTIYNISIGSSLNITIPEVTNQDAHYVMVPMYYNLSNIGDVSNLTASVEYVNNTATSDVTPSLLLGYEGGTGVTSIDKCTGLSSLQKKGYWTEDRVTVKTTIKDNVETSTSPTDPVNIRGEHSLPLTASSSGTIVMFLPENNGKTNREVVLRITGTYKGTNITIGSRSFVQLCPNWKKWTDSENTVKYIGIERIEENYGENDDKLYPFGFKYNRVVTYNNSTIAIRLLYSNTIESLIGVTVDSNTTLGDHQTGNGFITYTVSEGLLSTGNYISKIVLNYGATNNLGTAASNEDGLTNTKNLYHFTGGINMAELETQLDSYVRDLWLIFISVPILQRSISQNSSTVSSDYAAFTAMKKNRFSEIEEILEDQDNNIKETTYVPTIADSKIEWFLPSLKQAPSISDTDTYKMTGSYWTSTSVEDGNNANAYYYSFTDAGVYSGTNNGDRITPERKVRAAIYWTGTGSPIPTE